MNRVQLFDRATRQAMAVAVLRGQGKSAAAYADGQAVGRAYHGPLLTRDEVSAMADAYVCKKYGSKQLESATCRAWYDGFRTSQGQDI